MSKIEGTEMNLQKILSLSFQAILKDSVASVLYMTHDVDLTLFTRQLQHHLTVSDTDGRLWHLA